MSERIIQFGEDARLSGVLREVPASEASRAQLPVLLFNAGVIHRIGAHRLNVKLAHALSAAGRTSLRIDLSGLGESAPAPSGDGYEQQAITDISAGVDVLAVETGVDRAVSIGMCSGADNAYRAALCDPRLSHLVLLDPYAYANEAAARADLVARVASPDRWARKIRGLFSAREMSATPSDANSHDGMDDDAPYEQGRPVPDRAAFGTELKRLTDSGVKILIIYTGLVRALTMKSEHFFQTFSDFDFAGNIDVHTMPHTDHTFTQIAAQRELITTILRWLDKP